jgi:tRNA threonylcarbamoyladenosine modification (KEOPS) complex  Pcc1 subunit
MSEGDFPWSAVLSVRSGTPELVVVLERALWPEASREVPRARADLRRPSPDRLELAIQARDTGSLRAATNTYLGWLQLALATAREAGALPPVEPPR